MLIFSARAFPMPARTFFCAERVNSLSRSKSISNFSTSAVLDKLSMLPVITKGYASGTLCPLFATISLCTVAAMAERIAFLFSFLLIFRSQIFSALGGMRTMLTPCLRRKCSNPTEPCSSARSYLSVNSADTQSVTAAVLSPSFA